MKLCAICGIRPATTSDHIPPRGLYTKPYPQVLHTVPACPNCNQGGSQSDEIVKIMVGLSTGERREDSPLVLESMRRTLGHNKKLGRKMAQSAQHTFHHFNGQILLPAIAVKFDGKPYREVMTRIVRALYWVEKGSALGLSAKVVIEAFDQITDSVRQTMLKVILDSLEPRHLNQSTFIYKVMFDESGKSVWGLMFFNAHLVIAVVDAPAHAAAQAQPQS